MRAITKRLTPLLFFAATISAYAAGFDCAKAKTPQEKAICSSPLLSSADEQMASAFKNALAATPLEMVSDVRADQRAWLDFVARECPADRVRFEVDMNGCLHQAYEQRTKELRRLVQHKGGVTFVWRSLWLMNKAEPPSDDSEDDAANDIDLIPGYGTLAVSWPQTNAAAPEWQAWNRAVVSAARRLASQNHSASDGQWHSEWADDDDGELNVTIGTVNSRLVTAFVDRWGYRGAHPWESSIQLNWLLSEQRALRAADVFRPNSDWNQFIQQRCMRDLAKSLGQHYSYYGSDQLADVLHNIIDDPENWRLDGHGITIIFQDYAIAPRMLHPGPVTVPWSEVRSFLNPAFAIPAE